MKVVLRSVRWWWICVWRGEEGEERERKGEGEGTGESGACYRWALRNVGVAGGRVGGRWKWGRRDQQEVGLEEKRVRQR